MSGRNQKRKKKFSDKLGTKSEITKNLDECEDKIGAQPVIYSLFDLWQHTAKDDHRNFNRKFQKNIFCFINNFFFDSVANA